MIISVTMDHKIYKLSGKRLPPFFGPPASQKGPIK